jgi:hypothetical protein
VERFLSHLARGARGRPPPSGKACMPWSFSTGMSSTSPFSARLPRSAPNAAHGHPPGSPRRRSSSSLHKAVEAADGPHHSTHPAFRPRACRWNGVAGHKPKTAADRKCPACWRGGGWGDSEAAWSRIDGINPLYINDLNAITASMYEYIDCRGGPTESRYRGGHFRGRGPSVIHRSPAVVAGLSARAG